MVEEPTRLPKIARDFDDFIKTVEGTLESDPMWRDAQERYREETIERQGEDENVLRGWYGK